jgi:transcriptional regulator with GAF, ATPase, and Fis domain
MTPELRSPDASLRLQLIGKIITIGSSPDCQARLSGLPLRAAHLLFSGGSYRLQQLHAELKVLVNDAPVGCGVALKHGDLIRIGEHALQYMERETSGASAPISQASGGVSSMLRDVIDIAVMLLSSREESLFNSLVESVSRLMRCDAARLVVDDGEGKRTTVARFPQQAGLDRFSNRAIDWAKEASRTILMHEDEWKQTENAGLSLEKNLIASVLCAPLLQGASLAGFLYLDRIDKSDPFTDEERLLCDALLPLFSEILAGFQERRRQQETIARLQREQTDPAGAILYESDCMGKLMELARRFARTDAPVLITGETGTGKELMARFVHDRSSRASGPFRVINCGAIPENLIESELFGHEKGAFTGAINRKAGLFETAQKGTIFLDEIGELPLHLQAKLLRVLQESQIMHVGGTETISVDVRIVAATNRELEAAVTSGTFRQDLFFRLHVLTLHIPPLRERGDDVLLLCAYFIKHYCQRFGLPEKTLLTPARNALKKHSWPGNVRELENVLQKAILLSEGDRLTQEDLSIPSGGAQATNDAESGCEPLRVVRAEAEKRAIMKALIATRGNVSRASHLLDIDRKWLIKKMEELGVQADTYRR